MQSEREDGNRIWVAHELLRVDSAKVPVLDCGCNFQVRAIVPEIEHSTMPAAESNQRGAEEHASNDHQ